MSEPFETYFFWRNLSKIANTTLHYLYLKTTIFCLFRLSFKIYMINKKKHMKKEKQLKEIKEATDCDMEIDFILSVYFLYILFKPSMSTYTQYVTLLCVFSKFIKCIIQYIILQIF